MINNIKTKRLVRSSLLVVTAFVISISVSSCDFEYDIAETGSIADLTPPEAKFTATQNNGSDDGDWLIYDFANQSSSATTYVWDFGDGNTSTALEPSNTYPEEGTFTVILTALDNLGVTSTFSEEIMVVEPLEPVVITPVISEWAFEDGTGEGGDTLGCVFIQSDGTPREQTDNGTNCWRIIGGKVHQTSSDGAYTIPFDDSSGKTQGAKYPDSSGDPRVSYQAITVTPNAKYVVTYHYALKNAGDKVRIGILDGWMNDASELAATGFLAEDDGDVALGKNNFTEEIFEFEANATGQVAIWIDNVSTGDTYVDNITIVPAP